MMSPRNSTVYFFASFVILSTALAGCNVGQGVKKLGSKSANGSGTPSTDSDSFAITLAYRDPVTDATTPSRTISLQGIRAVASANLVNECGATGNQCTCEFYRTSTDLVPATASSVGISSQNNSFSCVIPAAITDAEIVASTAPNSPMYVKLKRVDVAAKNTGLLTVKSTLTIEDVLGSNLSRNKVRGIYRYACSRTFFEGEGVTAAQINCTGFQRLGLITAAYNFYIYRSAEDSNAAGGDSTFPADICQRTNFLKIQCAGNAPELRYGFYKELSEPFVVGITMTRAPEGENLTATYGYAALPDSAGNCPTGLIKVRPWVAQPASILSNMLEPGSPPTSFINTNNSLNNTLVEKDQPSPNFVVNRQKNAQACAASGDCTGATFAGLTQAQSVTYTSLTPVVCAIPSNLLGGLF